MLILLILLVCLGCLRCRLSCVFVVVCNRELVVELRLLVWLVSKLSFFLPLLLLLLLVHLELLVLLHLVVLLFFPFLSPSSSPCFSFFFFLLPLVAMFLPGYKKGTLTLPAIRIGLAEDSGHSFEENCG